MLEVVHGSYFTLRSLFPSRPVAPRQAACLLGCCTFTVLRSPLALWFMAARKISFLLFFHPTSLFLVIWSMHELTFTSMYRVNWILKISSWPFFLQTVRRAVGLLSWSRCNLIKIKLIKYRGLFIWFKANHVSWFAKKVTLNYTQRWSGEQKRKSLSDDELQVKLAGRKKRDSWFK